MFTCTLSGMSGGNPNWNRLVHNVANDLSDIIGGHNQINILNSTAAKSIYDFNIKCKDGLFALRFCLGDDSQSLEFIAEQGGSETLPESAKSAYPKIVEYVMDCKNTNIEKRFVHKSAKFLAGLADSFKSMFGDSVVRQDHAFVMNGGNHTIAEVYFYKGNKIRIFALDGTVLERIHIIADAYVNEFYLECSKSHVTLQKWQAKSGELIV